MGRDPVDETRSINIDRLRLSFPHLIMIIGILGGGTGAWINAMTQINAIRSTYDLRLHELRSEIAAQNFKLMRLEEDLTRQEIRVDKIER